MDSFGDQSFVNQYQVPFTFEFEPPILDSCKQYSFQCVTKRNIPVPPLIRHVKMKSLSELIDDLLEELYSNEKAWGDYQVYRKRSISLGSSCLSTSTGRTEYFYDQKTYEDLGRAELLLYLRNLNQRVRQLGRNLGHCLKTRDKLLQRQWNLNHTMTLILNHISGDSNAKFSVSPLGGDGDFDQWLHAMRLVARLPTGVPTHFRKKLWLTLAERHLTERGVDWSRAERVCFRVTQNADDTELGSQIVKDLHRTGCSLFCGAEGRENQAMLRRVLLGYARWNKEVGYCQGFNMLAAIILEVMDKSEADSLKVMIYLVEAVLPEGYFAEGLRGLSADMAAFRDLLRIRLPKLAQHMDRLQRASDGGGVEPPLPDVFTMQWFLTLYATWLPRPALLRIWDMIFLDGNEILLLTALAIWEHLQDRILATRSADEFYGCMGMAGGSGGAGAVWDAGDLLANRVASLGGAPELPKLRDHHRLTMAPLHSAVQSVTKRGLRLFYSEDEGDSSDDNNKLALATVGEARYESSFAGSDRLSLDIGALKRQYARLRERQRQAHIILAAACARHAAVGVPTNPTSLAVNHLLLGKSAIVSNKGRRLGPPPGTIPPSRRSSKTTSDDFEEIKWEEEQSRKSSVRKNSIKWKDIKKSLRKLSLESEDGECGDGEIVSQREADEIASRLRSRKSSESSSYSTRSSSSSDTSLCDDKLSDGESEICSLQEDFQVIRQEPIADDLSKWSEVISETDVNIDEEIPVPQYASCHSDEIEINTSTPKKFYENCPDEFKLLANKEIIEPTKEPRTDYSDIVKESESVEPTVTSPIDDKIQPRHFNSYYEKFKTMSEEISVEHNFFTLRSDNIINEKNIGSNESINKISSKPCDVIDDLIRYPNFMPDISLSDFNDEISPARSPGCDSIAISEDEPPIPLKIDEYFEDSPDFFGARQIVTDGRYDENIKNRRKPKRHSRSPKKVETSSNDSSYNEIPSLSPMKDTKYSEYRLPTEETQEHLSDIIDETSSSHIKTTLQSLPEYETIDISEKSNSILDYKNYNDKYEDHNSSSKITKYQRKPSNDDLEQSLESGRRNSEKALEIIQENSKILNRILTTKISSSNLSDTLSSTLKSISDTFVKSPLPNTACAEIKVEGSAPQHTSSANTFTEFNTAKTQTFKGGSISKPRPISLDETSTTFKNSFYFEKDKIKCKTLAEIPKQSIQEHAVEPYGWESKGFSVKDTSPKMDIYRREKSYSPYRKRHDYYLETKNYELGIELDDQTSRASDSSHFEMKHNWYSKSKDDSCETYSNQASKYSDRLFSKASDICSKYLDKGSKTYEVSQKDDSQQSDFAYVVTSSISFSYDKSAIEESPIGVKSDSSDTLCQVDSLDQISTPISPKIFPKETPLMLDKIDSKLEGHMSAVTPSADNDTLSSLSFPRSPSSGSFHPFPTRPIRTPKDIGIRLGMYSRESINSPTK